MNLKNSKILIVYKSVCQKIKFIIFSQSQELAKKIKVAS